MSTNRFDTLIVGGGVSGLYAAWRLIGAGRDPKSLAVLEASDRLGGRLWSDWLHEQASLPAELGGMFFNDEQPLTFGLCDRVFGLEKESITPRPDFAWLRATRFRVDAFADPNVMPYQLAPEEAGLPYQQLLLLAVDRIAPDIRQYWPFDPDRHRDESLDYLRTLEFDGRPLYQWGFWNLLARVLSNEAWLALRDMVSSHTLFANWNGFDALAALVLEQAGDWYRLTGGYQQLPERMASELAGAGVQILKRHALTRVQVEGAGSVSLDVAADGQARRFEASSLVLALPRRALSDLVQASPDLERTGLADRLDAVDGIPACKIFLAFDEPWWRDVPDGPGRIGEGTYAVSHTDLPLRQCYYLGVDASTGRGLMLASYADGHAVRFWQALMENSGRGGSLRSPLGRLAREEIRRQLSLMHGVDVPEPADGVFINWTRAPFGGGWHNWQPGWKSWETMVRMLRPVEGLNLHVCGEAYSAAQGWVQGALESAEALLQEEFGLKPPSWLGDSACLAAYRKAGNPAR